MLSVIITVGYRHLDVTPCQSGKDCRRSNGEIVAKSLRKTVTHFHRLVITVWLNINVACGDIEWSPVQVRP